MALTLRLIAGLSPSEVASAILVSEETVPKRLVRAKYKIKAASIPYRVPDGAEGGDGSGRSSSRQPRRHGARSREPRSACELADELEGYCPLHAARGALLDRLGRPTDAAPAYARAAELATTETARRFLRGRATPLA